MRVQKLFADILTFMHGAYFSDREVNILASHETKISATSSYLPDSSNKCVALGTMLGALWDNSGPKLASVARLHSKTMDSTIDNKKCRGSNF